jgi:DNA ligase (NAD+)
LAQTHISPHAFRHNELYFQQARPEVSDHEYDMLVAQAEAYEKDYPLLRRDSPTQRVGENVKEGGAHVDHKVRIF